MRTLKTLPVAVALLASFASAGAVARADAGAPYALRIVLDLGTSRTVPAAHTAVIESRFGACDVAVIRANGNVYHTFAARDDIRGFALESGDEIRFVKGASNCALSLVVFAKPDAGDRFASGRY